MGLGPNRLCNSLLQVTQQQASHTELLSISHGRPDLTKQGNVCIMYIIICSGNVHLKAITVRRSVGPNHSPFDFSTGFSSLVSGDFSSDFPPSFVLVALLPKSLAFILVIKPGGALAA